MNNQLLQKPKYYIETVDCKHSFHDDVRILI
ncbi:hypothetical protein T03_7909 [Trichinella britovi]|uniref:Uncharacterized protein n=1 Tax=Trichinella britovi TaxID=45882 RepID=A0A0V1AKM9_TRIBR|nr:hypothetical protein T03_7909 [Trichinella britovi]